MTERQRHPSTAIPAATVEELAYRLYLRRLEPPMEPEQSQVKVRRDSAGKIIADDVSRRRNSKSLELIVRDVLRVAFDLGLVRVDAGRSNAQSTIT